MATSNIPSTTDSQLTELEKFARAQERTVDQVLGEAVDKYIKDKQWAALNSYGRAKSRELRLSEVDVPRLITESRQERSR
jgi:hypothetical protein